MRASERSGFRALGIAVLHVAFLAIVVWASANWIVSNKGILALYRYSLGTLPSYRYAERLNDAISATGKKVLLVGPSTVREGFDDQVMNRTSPQYTFVNSGVTSPGTIVHTELLVDMLRWYEIEVDELVLGLNSRMLASRPSPLLGTRYVDFMDYGESLYYLRFVHPRQSRRTREALYENHVWPMNRIATRLDYLVRYGLFELQRRFSWSGSKPRRAFERGSDPLVHRGGFRYRESRHRPELLSSHLDTMRRLGLLQAERYGGAAEIQSLRNTLNKARTVADRVTVVIMPEHSAVVDDFASFGDRPFNAVLEEFEAAGVRVVDRRRSIPDELIRDIAHLVPDGRVRLSTDIARAFPEMEP